MVRFVNIILTALVFFSCRTEDLTIREYINWVGKKDNGLYKDKKVDDFKFSCMLRPIEWISIHEIDKLKLNINSYDSIKKTYEGLQYFALKIVNSKIPELVSYKAEGDNEAYQNNFNYYTGGMKNDIYLVDNNDTLPCVLFHYERNYGSSPVNIFDIAFKDNSRKKEEKEEKQLVFNGEHIGVGIIKFDFEKADLKNIPKLKLN
jgi:hypothetical protein